MTPEQTPDYGEPWKMTPIDEQDSLFRLALIRTRNGVEVCDHYRKGTIRECDERGERIVACVNACAGMSDPAKEIEAMREDRHALIVAMRNKDKTLPTIAEICDRISDLHSENMAMREAIKEASLQVSAFLGFYSDSLTLPQMRSLSECINKLQSFLTEPKQHEQSKHQH